MGLQQLPPWIIATILSFIRAQELAGSQTVWKLPRAVLDRLWRACYEQDYERNTSDSKAIAVNGTQTSWSLRYRRRRQIELNWMSGKYRVRDIGGLPAAMRCACQGPGSTIFVSCVDGSLLQLDVELGTALQQLSVGDDIHCMTCTETLLFAASLDSVTAWLLAVPDAKVQQVFPTQGHAVLTMQSDGQRLAATTDDAFRLWRVDTGELLHHIDFPASNVSEMLAVDWSRDLACVGTYGSLCQISLSSGHVTPSVDVDLHNVCSLNVQSGTQRILVTHRQQLHTIYGDCLALGRIHFVVVLVARSPQTIPHHSRKFPHRLAASKVLRSCKA